MASVTNIGKGFSGKLGSVIFRSWGGKTFVSLTPRVKSKRYRKESHRQKLNRLKFADAAREVKTLLLDPAMKEKYQQRARNLNLPNAYTAALQEIMSKPYK